MPHVEDLGYAFVIHGRAHGAEGTLVQTDWEYPSTARDLGWSLARVQHRGARVVALTRRGKGCEHRGTDGTVNCPDCGITASDFINAAGAFLARIAR